jgi:hypothetical protein
VSRTNPQPGERRAWEIRSRSRNCRSSCAYVSLPFALPQFFSANPVDESDDSPMITAVNDNLARSSSRLGHGPLKAGARVRVPYALPVDLQVSRAARFPS